MKKSDVTPEMIEEHSKECLHCWLLISMGAYFEQRGEEFDTGECIAAMARLLGEIIGSDCRREVLEVALAAVAAGVRETALQWADEERFDRDDRMTHESSHAKH